MVAIKTIDKEQLYRIKEIDRGEEIFEIYQYENSRLVTMPHRETVAGFEPSELENIISRQLKLTDQGGRIFGAFDDGRFVGIASIENNKRGITGDYRKMDILYVSRPYQGKGIGRQLLEACKQAAREFNADKLYISATPTKNTVDFYLRNGAVPVLEPDRALYAAEPDDVHLELGV